MRELHEDFQSEVQTKGEIAARPLWVDMICSGPMGPFRAEVWGSSFSGVKSPASKDIPTRARGTTWEGHKTVYLGTHCVVVKTKRTGGDDKELNSSRQRS